VSTEPGTRRIAGQHARAKAKNLAWTRFLGGSFKRNHGAWSQGAEGEEVVGRILEELAGDGWNVIHDVSFGRGNIDHVVIGPGGIFTVETKSHGGKIFLDHLDPKMVGQAYAEKKTLETITHMEVHSLLVFSRAYIVGRVPAWRRGVAILPARMLAGYLTRRKAVMSTERAAVIYRRLALAVGQAASTS
jgi:hypothetical protein